MTNHWRVSAKFYSNVCYADGTFNNQWTFKLEDKIFRFPTLYLKEFSIRKNLKIKSHPTQIMHWVWEIATSSKKRKLKRQLSNLNGGWIGGVTWIPVLTTNRKAIFLSNFLVFHKLQILLCCKFQYDSCLVISSQLNHFNQISMMLSGAADL